MVRELGMKQSMLNPNTRCPGDEHFTGRMQVAILNNFPSTTFGSLTAILAPYVGCLLCKVTWVVTSLGETEGWQQAKGLRSVKNPNEARAGKGPIG